MSLTYTTYLSTLATITAISASNADFLSMYPSVIDYAEGRIYRELDLLSNTYRDGSGSLTPNSRNFTLPTPAPGTFVYVESVNVISPAATAPDSGTRTILMPVTIPLVDFIAPSTSGATLPAVYAMVTDQTLIVGPTPDAAYRLEVIGSIVPAALSATNTTTFLTQYLPDLFVAAGMVFLSGYMRDFGAQTDDPHMSQSWENQYQLLKASADAQELRKKVTVFTGRTVQNAPRHP